MKNNKYLFRTKTCPNCKEKFTKRMPEKRIFCSRECSFLFCRGKNSHMWKGGKPECVDCNEKVSSIYSKRCMRCNKKYMVGKNASNYKGLDGRIKDGRYVRLLLKNNTYVYEHRMVVEKEIGRKLKDYEHIHHIDHDGYNNSPSNLLVIDNKNHGKYHAFLRWHGREEYDKLEIEA